MKIKEIFRRAKILTTYAAKMLTMPLGTSYEVKGQPVGRIKYTLSTSRMALKMLKGRVLK